ncbi:plasmid replication, integration and excision activator [Kribbella sp. C-35]|uniref:plasmid replication, integration and excision activator n=1 Tax=Kribbella sp. C-35 TaxID=2789276 RepID=UPI00397E1C5D
MSMPRRVMVQFGLAFPYGLYAVGPVEPELDFERSSKDRPVQARDKETEQLVWKVEVMDPDPDTKKNDRTFVVRLLAEVQPVLPESLPGLPFTPIHLEGLTAAPWVDTRSCTGPENGKGHRCRARQGWSYRATDVKAPKNMPGSAAQSRSTSGDKAA